ncbi:hypothetical protein QQP08_027739 [Theobroma cacao]|nr:hypothetical protein QQP08_027739 [Theobroma cacao]
MDADLYLINLHYLCPEYSLNGILWIQVKSISCNHAICNFDRFGLEKAYIIKLLVICGALI